MSREDIEARITPRISSRVIGGPAVAILAISIALGLIRPWEDERLVPYRDIVGVLTVCDGHTGPDIEHRTYTHGECQRILGRDVIAHADGMARCMTRAAPPQVFGAMVSLTFNIGVGNVCRSSAIRHINAGDWPGACYQMRVWNTAGGRGIRGLTNRRNAERAVCARAAA